MGIIHFIWLGERPLPNDSIARVQKWKTVNPETKIWLWVDKSSLTTEIKVIYQREFPDGSGIQQIDLAVLAEKIESCTLADKAQLRTLFSIALYEANRLKPNYGAASDILRYLILYLFAGSDEAGWNAYFDHDVDTDSQSIDSFLAAASPTESFFFAQNSQKLEMSSNDALICTKPFHFILQRALHQVLENYTQAITYDPLARPLLYEYTDIEVTISSEHRAIKPTVFRTGPQAFIAALAQLYNEGKLSGWIEDDFVTDTALGRRVAFLAPKASAIPLTVCPGSAGKNSWIKISTRPSKTIIDAFNNVFESIQLEATCFGILRLDDHVKDIVDSIDEGIKRLSAELDGTELATKPAGAGAFPRKSAAATTSEYDLSDLSLNELARHFPTLTSTLYSKPTGFEQQIARVLVKILADRHLDLTRVKECQYVSRYKIIRKYYDTKLPIALDQSDDNLEIAARTLTAMLMEAFRGEPLWGIEEFEEISNYWLNKIRVEARYIYADRLAGDIRRYSSRPLAHIGIAAANTRLSPADAPVTHASTHPSETTAVNLAAHSDSAARDARSKHRGDGKKNCIIM